MFFLCSVSVHYVDKNKLFVEIYRIGAAANMWYRYLCVMCSFCVEKERKRQMMRCRIVQENIYSALI